MSLADALNFEKFFAKDTLKNLKKDPKRLILGVDPASTEAWNAILGRDDKPLVNQFGGPRKGAYERANREGIDTGTASTLHGIAQTVAGAYGAAGVGGAFNGGSGLDAGWGSGANLNAAANGGSAGFESAPSAAGAASNFRQLPGMQSQQQPDTSHDELLREMQAQEEERRRRFAEQRRQAMAREEMARLAMG